MESISFSPFSLIVGFTIELKIILLIHLKYLEKNKEGFFFFQIISNIQPSTEELKPFFFFEGVFLSFFLLYKLRDHRYYLWTHTG